MAFLVAGAALVSARAAHAADPDASALRAADTAKREYTRGKIVAAKRRLEKALKSCRNDRCSNEVVARLYRDLGVVHIGGLGEAQEGREALARAVQADPAIRLDEDVTTPDIAQAFREIGGGGAGEEEQSDEGPRQSEKSADEVVLEEEPSKPLAPRWNWLSLSFQQDFFMHPKTRPVCGGSDYTCFAAGGAEFGGPIYEAEGNSAPGGIGVANQRVMLGFDHVFNGNVMLGGRVGYAFGGAPTGKNGDKFLPLHAEIRAAYFIDSAAFTHRGFRPYAALSIGVAEVDAHIVVDYYVDEDGYHAGQKGTVDAWRKTGKTFFAPALGTQLAFGSASALTAELRLGVMLGASGLAPALNIGYAHGL